jgi:hypothetical protein
LKPDATGQTRYRVDYTIRLKEAHAGRDLFSALGKLIRKEQRKGETTVSYEFVGMRPTAVLHVEIRAQEAGPGDHALRVAVTDLNSGAKAARETAFRVQKADEQQVGLPRAEGVPPDDHVERGEKTSPSFFSSTWRSRA